MVNFKGLLLLRPINDQALSFAPNPCPHTKTLQRMPADVGGNPERLPLVPEKPKRSTSCIATIFGVHRCNSRGP